jgi:hypothetical protein
VLSLSKDEFAANEAELKAQIRGRLPTEPADGAGGSALLTVDTLSGAVLSRRFDSDDTLQNLIDWVFSSEQVAGRDWELFNHTVFPPTRLTDGRVTATLEAAGLWPSGRVKMQARGSTAMSGVVAPQPLGFCD